MTIPENVNSLYQHEELLRGESLNAIRESTDFSLHLHMIERAMVLFHYFSCTYEHNSKDQLTIQLLGIRFFNGVSAAVKLFLSGYYQASALQQRDLLEIVFLLDYFFLKKDLIAIWRKSTKTTQEEDLFRPVIIRKALDERDKFTGRKRAESYKVLCDYGAHPTYKGFVMLTPKPGENAVCGPFYEVTKLKASLEELVKISVQAGLHFTRFFEGKCRADFEIKLNFQENQGAWFEKVYNLKFDRTQIEEIRKSLKDSKFK